MRYFTKDTIQIVSYKICKSRKLNAPEIFETRNPSGGDELDEWEKEAALPIITKISLSDRLSVLVMQ